MKLTEPRPSHIGAITALSRDDKQILEKIANTIRGLAMDATQKANSGHPGMPMGCAEMGAYLYGMMLNHNPKNPKWLNRDRLILSGGHGSMWLYSCLHLSGFELSMEEIQNFRQFGSDTPGHPEEHTPGVETTTGPLGQGVGNAVGQALGLKILGGRFNTAEHNLFDAKVYLVMTDGDMMEGVASEASALAGHWKLDNLIALYDANQICLDGNLSDCSTEDTKKRYQAYGWDVFEIDGNDLEALHTTLSHVRSTQQKPTIIICRTVIGKGSPNKAGTHKVHGSPLGEAEVKAAKEALGIPQEAFYVPQEVYEFFEQRKRSGAMLESEWNRKLDAWGKKHPELFRDFEVMSKHREAHGVEELLWNLEIKSPISGRMASHAIIQNLGANFPYLYGGSADLSCSDMTLMDKQEIVQSPHYKGKNIKFGVREFAMAAIATGLEHTGMILPFIGTFLTFSDYMRNAIRLCALMRSHVFYHFTHDSIFLGEDGPTHQPIEHLASLRAMPNLHVIRPADANEVKMGWLAALRYKGPTAFIFSRQNLPELPGTNVPYAEGVGRGAYILRKEKQKPDFTLIATGSEVSLACDVSDALERHGKSVRVVSMPCWEIFENQPAEYRKEILGGDLGKRVAIEAGSSFGWHKYIGMDGVAICIDTFGASAPQKVLAEKFGFTVEAILEKILS